MQFRYKPGRQTYVAFEGAIRTMQGAAEANKKLLVRYGGSAQGRHPAAGRAGAGAGVGHPHDGQPARLSLGMAALANAVSVGKTESAVADGRACLQIERV